MRHGRLLAEDSPSRLLSSHGATSLESVFLKLCVQTDNGGDSDIGAGADPAARSAKSAAGTLTGTLTRTLKLGGGSGSNNGTVSSRKDGLVYPGITAMAEDCSIQGLSYAKKPAEETEFQKIKRRLSMKRAPSFRSGGGGFGGGPESPGCCQWTLPYPRNIAALMTKNFIKMRRNVSQLMFIFLLPALEVIFFCGAIGRDPDSLPLGVVNLEVPPDPAHPDNCFVADGCDFTNVSCRFYDVLFAQEALVAREFADVDSAVQAVQRGEVKCPLVLSDDHFPHFYQLFSFSRFGAWSKLRPTSPSTS